MDVGDLTDPGMPDGSTAIRFLRGGAWAASGKAVTMTATLILNAIVARLLSPRDVGVYFLILSVVPLGMALGNVGLKDAIVKVVAEQMGRGHPGRARSSIRIALQWAAIGSVLVAAAFLLVSGRWTPSEILDLQDAGSLLILVSILVILLTASTQVAETFRGLHDIRLATVTNGLAISVLPSVGVLGLWIVLRETHLVDVIAVHVGAVLTTLVFAGWLLIRKMSTMGPSEPIDQGDLLRLSLPLLVGNLSIMLQARIGLWIVAVMLPTSDVALFGAASRLVMLVATPLILVDAVVAPMIAELYATGRREELEHLLRSVAALAAVLSLIVLAVYSMLGRPILGIVFGQFYDSAWMILLILSIGQTIKAVTGPCSLTLMMTGNQNALMVIASFSTALQIVLGVTLGYMYGLEGIALAVTGVLFAENSGMLLWTRFKTGVWTLASFRRLIEGSRSMFGSA